MFEETRALLASVKRDLVQEMLKAEAEMISDVQAQRMRTLVGNSLGVFAKSFQAELKKEFGDTVMGSPLEDLSAADDAQGDSEKNRRRAVRVLVALLRDLGELSKAEWTSQTIRVDTREGLSKEELFSLDYVRTVEARLMAISRILDEMATEATSAASPFSSLQELSLRLSRFDPLAASIAARLLTVFGDRKEVLKILSRRLAIQDQVAELIYDRVQQLHQQAAMADSGSVAESIELAGLVYQAIAQEVMDGPNTPSG